MRKILNTCFGWLGKKLKRMWKWFIRKSTPSIKNICVGVTMIVIMHFTINMSIEAGNIAKELYETKTKTLTITNFIRTSDNRTVIDNGQDRESDRGIKEDAPEKSIEEKITEVFPEESETAIAIFKAESGLDPEAESTTDKLKDGRPFSIGLTQINITVHEVDGLKCHEAFQGKDYTAVVIDEDLYSKCIKAAKDPDKNLAVAGGIYERSGDNFGRWGAFTNESYIKFLNI